MQIIWEFVVQWTFEKLLAVARATAKHNEDQNNNWNEFPFVLLRWLSEEKAKFVQKLHAVVRAQHFLFSLIIDFHELLLMDMTFASLSRVNEFVSHSAPFELLTEWILSMEQLAVFMNKARALQESLKQIKFILQETTLGIDGIVVVPREFNVLFLDSTTSLRL